MSVQELCVGEILKVNNDEQQTVTGWASVIEEGGQPLIDRQEDIIDEPILVKAAHDFILDSRAGKLMHQGKRVADVVESCVMTKELQKVLGVVVKNEKGQQIVGWLITMKIRDPKLWEEAKNGEFTSFSIGGVGRREEV